LPSYPPTLLADFAQFLRAKYTPAQVRRATAPPRKLSLIDFAARYLTSEGPAGLRSLRPECSLHHWLVSEFDALATARGQRRAILAPRGNAKSTWATFAYPIWCACHGTEPYIVLTSDTGDQARQYLDNIRNELEGNDGLLRDYPDLVEGATSWSQDKVRLGNGVVLKALGTGSKIRGRRERQHRPTLILVDDPQNEEHIISPLQRERSWNWLVKDVCNAGGPRTNILVLGTALHRESIVCRLQTTPGWQCRVFRSIIQWPARMDLWREWEDILLDHRNPEREAAARSFYLAHEGEMNE
jgi:hypothetical protein